MSAGYELQRLPSDKTGFSGMEGISRSHSGALAARRIPAFGIGPTVATPVSKAPVAAPGSGRQNFLMPKMAHAELCYSDPNYTDLARPIKLRNIVKVAFT